MNASSRMLSRKKGNRIFMSDEDLLSSVNSDAQPESSSNVEERSPRGSQQRQNETAQKAVLETYNTLRDLDDLMAELKKDSKLQDRALTNRLRKSDIQSGRVFLFSVKGMKNPADKFWRLDDMMWLHNGSYTHPKTSPNPRFRYFRHQLRLNNKSLPLKRIEARLFGCEFDNLDSWDFPFVLVAYFGEYDVTLYPDILHHGNAKEPEEKVKRRRLQTVLNVSEEPESDDDFVCRSPKRRYIRSSESLMVTLRTQVKENKTPQQIHYEITNEALAAGKGLENVPKNLNQISKIKQKYCQVDKVEDDILEVLYFAMTTNFVPFQSIREGRFAAVCVVPEMVEHVRQILRQRTTLTLHYDSTFNIGLYFTSILVYKHPYLQDKPVIPLAFYFHQRKDEKAHDDFFGTIVDLLPLLNSDLVCLVTDRENSIKLAVRNKLPGAVYFHCDEHLKSNILHSKTFADLPMKLRGNKMTEVTRLIHSSTEGLFESALESCQRSWEQECPQFCSYFLKNILKDLRNSSKFIAEPYGVFYPIAGVSNNPSESINSVFKSLIGRQKNMAISAAMKKSILMTRGKLNRIKLAIQEQYGEFSVAKDCIRKAKELEFPLLMN